MSSLKRTREHTHSHKRVLATTQQRLLQQPQSITPFDIQSTSKSPRSYEQALYNALETSRHMKGSGRLKLRKDSKA